MIITKKYIRGLRERSFMEISPDAEKLLLEKLGQEPGEDDEGHPYSYTEQDIWEQARKIIQDN